ncbi:beta-ketoacyl [acyl carrier protein] synthase domain-containing protein [Streptomyces sp. NBC_00503]|uniref:beta-ketoacyl [acyl carrier protein] synthase domain-containing protein n=1 Tax=Streptomyces sp. NBC_00503 TaxID=2903659 RepID=UPI002E7FCFD1|nr:polyketide synthase [Streptomyces sp. NBC_00503]WUD86368.1 polyketide synthase [Streptomyces sp. NBC_00503]
MDEKEVLTRFKSGHLNRAQAAALLTGAGSGAGVRTRSDAGSGAGGTVPVPVAPARPDTGGKRAADGQAPLERIAVVGMAGRYPGAHDLETFWRQVREGRGSAGAPPPGRPGEEPGHYLERVQDFDAEFFGIDASEAALMDPQERLFLETAWEALEQAGCTGDRLDALTAADGTPRSVGVFTCAGTGDYGLLAARTRANGRPVRLPRGGHWSLPNRFSALLGLTGPSQSVDTAESSVLVALHLAAAALRGGECAAALVGGGRLLLHPSSRRPGAGEGVGALLLKPLERALADGDTVHCVIRGSAVGHTAPGRTVTGPGRGSRTGADADADTPAGGDGVLGQRVLREALRAAAVDASTVAVREDADSVRAFVGEAGAVTGAAALTRAVLQLSHRVLVPGPGRAEARAWTGGESAPRRASVGAYGAGGSAAHVILEEYLPAAGPGGGAEPAGAARAAGGAELVVLSAPTPAHLAATAARFAELLRGAGPVPALDVLARALRTGRAAMDCRFAAVVGDAGELAAVLQRFVADGGPCADLRDGGADPLDMGALPETADYLAALWRAGHLHQLRGLWLSGLDVNWGAMERAHGAGAVAVPLPASAFLRTPLWLGGEEERA